MLWFICFLSSIYFLYDNIKHSVYLFKKEEVFLMELEYIKKYVVEKIKNNALQIYSSYIYIVFICKTLLFFIYSIACSLLVNNFIYTFLAALILANSIFSLNYYKNIFFEKNPKKSFFVGVNFILRFSFSLLLIVVFIKLKWSDWF